MQENQQVESDPSIAIIGAGFSGIAAAIQLRKAGFAKLTIYEKGDGPGGVWRDNTYPGAACDIPSSLYSYSFEQRTDWSKKFPGQPEILAYLKSCVEKYELAPHFRPRVEIASATYGESDHEWQLRTVDGETMHHRFVIFACGQLNRPLTPDLPGHRTFHGPAFHSARWNHEVDLRRKRIAVIGNGASAIQFVPLIAGEATELCVFQRSPNWIIRKRDPVVSGSEQARLQRFPVLRIWRRLSTYLVHESRFLLFRKGSPAGWLYGKYLRRHLNRRIQSEELRGDLTPDFQVGCKRILLSGDWFKTLQKDNVRVNPSGAALIDPSSVTGGNGVRFEADVIIFATGFESIDFLAPISIRGRGGQLLSESWQDGAEAHLGITVAGFPNLFLLYGPNTNLGHNSIILMIEAQARYIRQAIEYAQSASLPALEVRPDIMRRSNQTVQKYADKTVWSGACQNWYKNAAGKIVNNWPRSSWRYLWQTRKPRKSDFLRD